MRQSSAPVHPLHRFSPPIAIREGRVLPPFLLLLLGLLLIGCTDDTSGPQFANEPRSGQEPATPVVVTAVPTIEPTETVPPRPLAELVRPRGAPERIFFVAGPEVWTVLASGAEAAKVFAAEPGSTVADTSSSPSGDRVAVLTASDSGETSLRVVTGDGDPVLSLRAFGDSASPEAAASRPDGATPVGATPSALATVVPSVDWSPQGDRLLIGDGAGRFSTVEVADLGTAESGLAEGFEGFARDAVWSPTGEQIAYLSQASEPGVGQALVVSGSNSDGPSATIVEGTDERSVTDLAWLPDGRSLLFTEGDPTSARLTNTDLWRVDSDGSDRKLVASAGIAAPVADIDRFVASPDGRAVAYTVTVPADGKANFHSLWVRDLAAGRSIPIDVPEGLSVSDLWWTSEGLVFRATAATPEPTSDDAFALFRVGAEGTPQPILRASIGAESGGATPEPTSP